MAVRTVYAGKVLQSEPVEEPATPATVAGPPAEAAAVERIEGDPLVTARATPPNNAATESPNMVIGTR
jgi:hypothetical protein